ncbi:hypothetical protein [Ancylomarina sp. 16SWW S1-10-2]|uniref:hypothetical protein n=1 Tax=Ancylomarina sp. 16SWW S1-10-2 TaxID=2499681 RepID=UPI0012AE522B|nr:hypothetical protein [Ancylomarina sp. 16SWW S1-10-2]MRT93639.1 hypothetical protein [Ancylomarina sp. 16SWW S1-10-2]
MKTEKKLNKVSISELIKLMLLMFILMIGLIFLYLIIAGKTGFSLHDSTWVLLIGTPIIFAVIQTSINRNSFIKLTDFEDLSSTIKLLDSFILKNGFVSVKQSIEHYEYAKKTKLERFYNLIVNEKIEIKIINNEIFVYAKSNIIDRIESTLLD